MQANLHVIVVVGKQDRLARVRARRRVYGGAAPSRGYARARVRAYPRARTRARELETCRGRLPERTSSRRTLVQVGPGPNTQRAVPDRRKIINSVL
jgi:hypothetical protein